MFKEFLVTKKVKDPEIRQAAEIGRSDDKIRIRHRAKSSVSVNTAKYGLIFLGLAGSLAAIYFIGKLIWNVFKIYAG